MEEYKFTGGQFHILFKPELVKPKKDKQQLDFDLTTPPALTEEQMETLAQLIEQAQPILHDTGVVMWITKGYKNF